MAHGLRPGDIRDGRECQYFHALLTRNERFRRGGHADGVRAERPQEALLGGGFVCWPADHRVDALAEDDAHARCRCMRPRPEMRRVDVRAVEEVWPAAQWIRPGETG